MTRGSDGNVYGLTRDEQLKANADGSVSLFFRFVQSPRITSFSRDSGTISLTWTSFTNGIYRAESR